MHFNRSDQIDALYCEGRALADRARAWFDGPGVAWRAALPVAARAEVAIESLAITARLMAAIAWLLDPAHQQRDELPPVHAFRADVQRPPSSVLEGTPAMALATESRRLVACVLAIATDATLVAPPVDTPPIEAPAIEALPVAALDDRQREPATDISTESGGLLRA